MHPASPSTLTPPFRIAGACCTPTPQVAPAQRRRARLTDLDMHLHCSIIGTCLGTAELRKLVPRHADVDKTRASELDLHHAAVQLAGGGGEPAKALHKALDERYDATLKRFSRARDEAEVLALWNASVKQGDIPGAYWALMTHPDATPQTRQVAFGEVHMLSHLVGAANRADIRRLVLLEQENAELKDKIGRQQQRLQDMSTRHDTAMREMAERLSTMPSRAEPDADASTRIEALQTELAAKDQALVHQATRRDAAEQRALQAEDAARSLQARLDKALALADSLGSEAAAVEAALGRQIEAAAQGEAIESLVRGRRLVYVGGRPGSNRTIRSLVQAAGGELMVHDGGIEDRKGLLAAALPGADLVVFPVDCIDHDSMGMLKRVCDRHGVAWHALRSSSVASFAALLADLAAQAEAAPQQAAVSRFCLKHG